MCRILKLAVILIAFLSTLYSCTSSDRYITITGYAQGGAYSVKLNLRGSHGMIAVAPEQIRDSIDSILRHIDNSLSGYNRNSLLSRFNRGETVIPDTLFMDMYRHAYRFYEMTDGMVDAAAAPLFDMWGFGFNSGDLPSDEKVAMTLRSCGMDRLENDMVSCVGEDLTLSSSSLLLPEYRGTALPSLNYNAIAQGYSCDLVASYLYSIGVKDMMVDIGEIFCDGRNPYGEPWTIGIDRPVDGNDTPGADMKAIFRMPDGPHGIVTSGNYRKFHVKDGKKYVHTINPVTGYPQTHSLLSATILAPDAVTADAYATYCMVLGFDKAKEVISSSDTLEGCLIYDDGDVMEMWCSDGFPVDEVR